MHCTHHKQFSRRLIWPSLLIINTVSATGYRYVPNAAKPEYSEGGSKALTNPMLLVLLRKNS